MDLLGVDLTGSLWTGSRCAKQGLKRRSNYYYLASARYFATNNKNIVLPTKVEKTLGNRKSW